MADDRYLLEKRVSNVLLERTDDLFSFQRWLLAKRKQVRFSRCINKELHQVIRGIDKDNLCGRWRGILTPSSLERSCSICRIFDAVHFLSLIGIRVGTKDQERHRRSTNGVEVQCMQSEFLANRNNKEQFF